MSAEEVLTLNRIEMVEKWLFELDLDSLSRQEAVFLAEPETANLEEIKKDLVKICEKRYKNNNFFPDLRKIGIVALKQKKPLERIFTIGL